MAKNNQILPTELLVEKKSAAPAEPLPSLAAIISALHREGLARLRRGHAAPTCSHPQTAAEPKTAVIRGNKSASTGKEGL